MAEKNVIRQDIVQVKWEVDNSGLNKITQEANKMKGSLGKSVNQGQKSFNKFDKSTKKSESAFKRFANSIKKVDTKSLDKVTASVDKLTGKLTGGLVSGAKSAAKALATVGAAGVAAFAAAGTSSIQNYAEYEQLVGGVKTLFGTEENSLSAYAKSMGKTAMEVNDEYQMLRKAQSIVLNNAGAAWKNQGMSANQYMETVTGFSASLKQSLGGDTVKAAEKANLALTDMSDNANKMGTDMEMIKNAYGGFAKQNYTMLDNLKLGYGGTQEEMKRLLKDAQKISGVKYDISSYADIVDAIHVVQTELGITGTTAKEASSTITGSINAMKSSWQNLLTGMADPDQDMGKLTDNFVESLVTVGKNLLPRIKGMVPRLAAGFVTLGKELIAEVVGNPEMYGPVSGMVEKISEKVKKFTGNAEKMGKVKDIFKSIKETAEPLISIVGKITDKIVDIATSDPVLDSLKTAFDGIKSVLEWVDKNMTAVGNAALFAGTMIGSLIVIVKTMSAVSKISNAIAAVTAAKKVLVAGATISEAAAMTTATGAQIGMNAAMFACPITWIVLGIAALIATIVLLVKNWDKVKEVSLNVWNKIKEVWGTVSSWFSEKVVTPVKTFFSEMFQNIGENVAEVKANIVDAFTTAYEKVTGAWSNITDFFSGIWKGAVTAVAGPVNKLIGGANWVLSKLGSEKRLTEWQPYARGTKGHPGGNAIVNDGRGAELVQMPDGRTFIPQGRNVLLPNAPKGMKVLDAQRTAKLMGKPGPTFHYEEGTGGGFWDSASALVSHILSKFVNFGGMSGFALSVGKGIVTSSTKALTDWVKGLLKNRKNKDEDKSKPKPKGGGGQPWPSIKNMEYAGGIGFSRVPLPEYSPERSVPVVAGNRSNTNNYSPSFTLNMSGTVDRTTERTIKRWVQEAMEETFATFERTAPRLTEV